MSIGSGTSRPVAVVCYGCGYQMAASEPDAECPYCGREAQQSVHPAWRQRLWPRRVWPAFVVTFLAILGGQAASIVLAIVVAAVIAPRGAPVDDIQDRVMAFAMTPAGFFLFGIASQGALFVAALGGAMLSRQRITRRLSLGRGHLPFWMWGMFIIATPIVGTVSAILVSMTGLEPGEALQELDTMFTESAGLFFVAMTLFITIAPGLFEEMLFRGYLQHRLLERWPPIAALGVSSLIFAAAHYDFSSVFHVVAVLPVGLWLGAVAWRAGSIWPAMLCHMANNLLSSVGARFESAADYQVEAGLFALIITGVSAAAMVLSIYLLIRYGRSVKRFG